MGIEKILMKSKERTSRAEIAQFLRALADKVEGGEVSLRRGEEELQLLISQDATLEIKVEEEEERPTGNKKTLEIEIEWYEGSIPNPKVEIV